MGRDKETDGAMDSALSRLPARKSLRLPDYDYSGTGVYFVTVCTANRENIFWSDRRGELCSPVNPADYRSPLPVELSAAGKIVDCEIQKLNTVYDALHVDKYCIMPNHIHFLVFIDADTDGRTQFAPTISRVMKQFKGSITKQVGRPIWQRSFYDHVVRNRNDYEDIYRYIEDNPARWRQDEWYREE